MTAVALRRVTWQHPETGAAGLAALAWLALLLPVTGAEPVRDLHADIHRSLPLLAGAGGWMLMTVAMMVPAALPVARDHALGALWARRQRTVALFFAGYLAVWAAFGVIASAAVAGARDGFGAPGAAVLAAVLLAGALWELTPAKWRAVRACHRVSPLPPRGPRADAACLRAGAVYGRRCVAGCWALMLAMAVAAHTSVGLMALLAGVVAAEKLLVRPARFAVPIAALLAFAAVVSIAG
jgi:predicted metal-binding membrane protein